MSASRFTLHNFTEQDGVAKAQIGLDERPFEIAFGPGATYQPLLISVGVGSLAGTMHVDALNVDTDKVQSFGLVAPRDVMLAFEGALGRVSVESRKSLLVVSGVGSEDMEWLQSELLYQAPQWGARPWLTQTDRTAGALSMELIHGPRFKGRVMAGDLQANHPDWAVTFEPGGSLQY